VNAIRFYFLVFVLGCNVLTARAEHTQVRLVPSAASARPGETVWVAIPLHMEAGWHTYWRNPGESGMATTIKWTLPPGVTAGAVRWPVPEKSVEAGITAYIYKNEVALLVPLTLAPDLKPGPVELKAKLSWLECAAECVPGEATATATIMVGPSTLAANDAASVVAWEKALPAAGLAPTTTAWWEAGAATNQTRSLRLQWQATPGVAEADFYPEANDDFDIQPATEKIPGSPELIQLRKLVKKSADNWPVEISGLLVEKFAGATQAYEIKLPVAQTPPAVGPAAGSVAPPVIPPSLWKMLLFAFIGGLILNIMPCVLPVIALKILGFVRQTEDGPRRVRKLGLIYAAGVLVSFLTLAGLVIGVKAAGHSAGWGMQFGNPQFLVALTLLVTLVALNLFGLFEINLGDRVMGSAGTLASRQGASGAFFNGVLATILATPCTAPFLGAALGFAFTQPAPFIVLVFMLVGLGLATPYVILSWHPAWLKFLPKSGPWMERFKVAMGFPMLITAAWLLSLTASHYGSRSWWLLLFLVLVALAAWVYGEFIQRGRTRRGLAWLAVLALLGGDYFYVLEGQLHWRVTRQDMSAVDVAEKNVSDGIDWQPWSTTAVAQARGAGHPVLVDFTADWCLTCQVNKKLAIEIPQVKARLKQVNAVTLVGDYTKLPAAITDELNHYGRAGVPLVLVYPVAPARSAIILPEVLTPGIVLDALEQVSH